MNSPLLKNKFSYKSHVSSKIIIENLKKNKFKFQSPKIIYLVYSYSLAVKICEVENLIVHSFLGAKLALDSNEKNYGVLFGFGIGSPALVAKIEELIAFGVEKFILIGTAGGISDELKIGDLVICDYAFRDEGSSYHYLSPEVKVGPSESLFNKAKEKFLINKISFRSGSTWTTDCPYRETLEEINYFKEKNVYTVDMEASALFALGTYYNKETLALFVISDLVSTDKEWVPSFHHKIVNKNLRLSWELLKQLSYTNSIK